VQRQSFFRFGRGSRSASLASDQPGNGSLQDGKHGSVSGHDFSDRGGYARQAGHSPQRDVSCGSRGREPGERTLSRVSFLGTGLVGAAAVAGLYAPSTKASTTVQVWGLDPSGGDHDACGCSACGACLAHAANKLFASVSDADASRAHPFCKCQVVPLVKVDERTYNALFVDGGARGSADRRHGWVLAALAQGPPLPDPPERADAPVRPKAAIRRVKASLLRARLYRVAGGKRVLHAEVHAAETVAVLLTLRRGRLPLAHRRIARVRGRQTLMLTIPSGVSAGSARLSVRLEDTAGRAKLETRDLYIAKERI
jgi:hypothetical protein